MKALTSGALTPLEALPPSAATVVALAEWRAGEARPALRTILIPDPGMLLAWTCLPEAARGWPRNAREAQRHVHALWDLLRSQEPARLAEWEAPSARNAHRTSQVVAQLARRLAGHCGVDPDRAEITGVLATLGSLSLHARGGDRRHVNGEVAPRTRQLARRLPLPAWLHDALLALDLPVDDDRQHRLTLVVQAALGQALAENLPLGELPRGHSLGDALRLLGVPEQEGARILWNQASPPPLSLPANAVPLLWRALRLVSPDGSPGGVIAKLEGELEALRAQALLRWQTDQARLDQLKLEALAEFAAGAAHEINTPLAIISGQAQHLLKTEESLDRAQALERIMSQAHKIHHLLRDLLIFARPPVPRTKPIALARLVRKVVDGFGRLALEKQLKVEFSPGPRGTVIGDPQLLEMAVASLVRNAMEAAPVKGWVRVSLQKPNAGRLAVVLEDDGPGLTTTQLHHLFDPFYSGRTAGRGTGLGLSKAWRIAELHGGSLQGPTADARPTRFILELPVRSSKRNRARRVVAKHA